MEFDYMIQLHRVIQSIYLQHIASRGKVSEIKIAIKLGADVNARDKGGWTPIMHAYSMHNTAAVELLKEQGATMTMEDKINAQIAVDLHRACGQIPMHRHRRVGARS
jgi:ankyrin repeat protein